MRKNFYYVQGLLLMGVLALGTSCVDNDESDSVKQVREAYANQLKAQSDLAKTQAEADKVKQDAEIALLNAQAEQLKTQAKLNEANAALALAQTETEKSKAEYEKQIAQEELKRLQAQVELEIEEAKVKLAQIQITAEIQMLKLQAELDKAKNQKDEILDQAINEYKVFIYKINDLKASIAKNELNLAYEQAVLADVKTSEDANTALAVSRFNDLITQTQVAIDQAKADQQRWKTLLESLGGESLEKKIDEATTAYKDLLVERSAVYAEYNKAKSKFENGAKKDLTDFRNLVGKSYTYDVYPYDMTYYTLSEINTNITTATTLIATYETKIKDNNAKIAELTITKDQLYADKEAADLDRQEAYKAYDKARDEYWANSTSANYQKMQDAYQVYNNADNKYYAISNNYSSVNYQISDLQYENNNISYSLSSQRQNLETNNKRKVAYGGDAQKADKLIAAYVSGKEEYDEAYAKYTAFEAKVTSQGNYLKELNTIYVSYELLYPNWSTGVTSTSYEYIKGLISDLDKSIALKEAAIISYKEDITKTKELNKKLIAQLEANIKSMEQTIAANKAELDIVQKQADAAKVIIDQRLK